MAPGGLLDRPRVRIVQLPSLHGWCGFARAFPVTIRGSRHEAVAGSSGASRRAEPGAVARAGPGLVRRVTGSARRSRW